MPEPNALGGDATGPYFFLSYAHTPRSDPNSDPDWWVEKLYKDVRDHVMQLTPIPADVPAGFMDRGMGLGEGWSEQLSEALAHCKVFVPLFSPRYFRSRQCGKEWWVFSQRLVLQRALHGRPLSGIVPALWVPVPPADMPGPAERLQFNHAEFGADYAAEGFYGLIKLSYLRQEYERAVYQLAKRIVRVIKETSIAEGRLMDYREVPSAFGPPGTSRDFEVTVLACSRDDLPDGRGPGCYGPSARHWNPYHPESTRPLADHAADLTRSLDYQVRVSEFEDAWPRLADTGPPSAPGLLLLDRWALCAHHRRRLVRELSDAGTPWVSVMVPWNRQDPDCDAHDDRLRRLTEEALARSGTEADGLRSAPGGHRSPPGGIPSLEAFGTELPVAVSRAAKHHAAHAPAFPPDGPHPSRPRLTGPTGAVPAGNGGRTGHGSTSTQDGTAYPDEPEGKDDREP